MCVCVYVRVCEYVCMCTETLTTFRTTDWQCPMIASCIFLLIIFRKLKEQNE